MLRELRSYCFSLVVCLPVGALGTGCADAPSVNEVTVVGTDYGFDVADTLPPGPTVFILTL